MAVTYLLLKLLIPCNVGKRDDDLKHGFDVYHNITAICQIGLYTYQFNLIMTCNQSHTPKIGSVGGCKS